MNKGDRGINDMQAILAKHSGAEHCALGEYLFRNGLAEGHPLFAQVLRKVVDCLIIEALQSGMVPTR